MRIATALPLLSLAVLGPFGSGGCRTTTALPERPADVTGVVTQVSPTPGQNAIGTLRVEANPADSSGSPKYVLTVTRSTILVVQPDEITERLGFADVVIGQRVQAWITGPVRESYPMQATASHVLVLDSAAANGTARR